jgi:5-methyltetrahydrofolate--homocysteine methyltransferase
MVGGAPTTAQWAEEIGADGWGEEVGDAVQKAKELVGAD